MGKQLTGKGLSGTFQLVDGANKTGTKYEDAIEDAIIAMNEPKDISVTSLRNYLGEYHKEYNTDQRPRALKNALDSRKLVAMSSTFQARDLLVHIGSVTPFIHLPMNFGEKKLRKNLKKRK